MRKLLGSLLILIIFISLFQTQICKAETDDKKQYLYDVYVIGDQKKINITTNKNQSIEFSFTGNVSYESNLPMKKDIYLSIYLGWPKGGEIDGIETTLEPEIMHFTETGNKPYQGHCNIPPIAESLTFDLYVRATAYDGVIIQRHHSDSYSMPVEIFMHNNTMNITTNSDNATTERNDNFLNLYLIISVPVIITIIFLSRLVYKKISNR